MDSKMQINSLSDIMVDYMSSNNLSQHEKVGIDKFLNWLQLTYPQVLETKFDLLPEIHSDDYYHPSSPHTSYYHQSSQHPNYNLNSSYLQSPTGYDSSRQTRKDNNISERGGERRREDKSSPTYQRLRTLPKPPSFTSSNNNNNSLIGDKNTTYSLI